MTIQDQGVQELAHHIETYFAEYIGHIPEKELCIMAACNYVKRYCVIGAQYQDTFDNITILHTAALFASTEKIVDDKDCDQCGTNARKTTCSSCGISRKITNCGHFDQPRPISAGIQGQPICNQCADSIFDYDEA